MGRDAGLPVNVVATRVATLAFTLVLATGLSLAPVAVRPVSAATGALLISADATYTVDPAAGAVHVSVAVAFTNDKPSTASSSYYWRDIGWGVPAEAVNIGARDGTGSLRVTSTVEDGYVDAQIRLRRNLNYRQTSKVTISWDLPGGAPRSASTVRVGEAFAAFDVWAWGDAGKSSVTVRLPAGFEVQASGSSLAETTGPDGVTLSATKIADSAEFWAFVSGTRERSLATDELTLPGSIRLVIRGWPEDLVWRTTVSDTLRLGLPKLQAMIGLPWPVTRRLEVSEVYAPLLEGYSGFFYAVEERIEISEELDELTIAHEASHAWFNDDLFRGRWITEGLADTYAAAVLDELGTDSPSPERPRVADEGHVDLQSWEFPGRITDESEARETYGYNASWWILRTLHAEIGPDRMRAIFSAAHDDTIAYRGAAAPEVVGETDDWRRFLDLLEEVGGSTKAVSLYREFVVTPTADRELDSRTDARVAYDALLTAGDGWLPPLYVRAPMGTWKFQRAMDRITEAEAVLDLRARIDDASVALGLEADGALETAYESASDGFESALSIGEAALVALAALDEAHAALATEPDFLSSIGLLGSQPDADYREAAAAFEAGDLEGASVAAGAATETLGNAAGVGRNRLTAAGGGVGAVLLVVGLAVFLRRRRPLVAQAAVPAGPEATAAPEPYATLAADPSASAPEEIGVRDQAVAPDPALNLEQDGGSVGGDRPDTVP